MSGLGPDLSNMRSDLVRLESFGDNCELGFVLRRLGYEDGALFRWSAISPESILAMLQRDFENLYEFDNLVPHETNMVHDRCYGAAWHSRLTSSLRNDKLTFDDDEPTRRSIHVMENAKRTHLIEKLRQKFKSPHPVFVIKRNSGIPPDLLRDIHYQLYRKVLSPHFTLLHVCEDPARAGTSDLLDRNLARGFVARFASYEQAEDGDDASWRRMLGQVLERSSDPGARSENACQPSFETVVLPFPADRDASLARRVPGDLRGGLARLLRGNEWCRLVDDDVYRLHATQRGQAATAIRWTGLHLPAGSHIRLEATCATRDSQPVRATLRIADDTGACSESVHVFRAGEPGIMVVTADQHGDGSMSASLTVEPTENLRPGERAVIDLEPIIATPD